MEQAGELAESLAVEAVPTFVLFKASCTAARAPCARALPEVCCCCGVCACCARARACVTAPVPAPPRAAPRCLQNATLLDRLEGADAAELAKRVERWRAAPAPVGAAADGGVPAALRELRARLEELVHANRIVRELPAAAAAHGAHRRGGGLSRGGQPRPAPTLRAA